MDDNTMIFPEYKITLRDLREVGKRSTSRTNAAKLLGINYAYFLRKVKEYDLFHLFEKKLVRKKGPLSDTANVVLKILKKEGQITAARIKKIANIDCIPSRPIHLLKSRGHIIHSKEKHPTEGIIWVYERYSKNHNYETEAGTFNLVERKLPCMLCGANITIKVRDGEHFDDRRLCAECRNKDEPRLEILERNGAVKLTRKVNEARARIKVDVFQPGDEEFERIKEEITHIADIKERIQTTMNHWEN